MEGIVSGLVNLGLGGVMAAALIWFLHHLVTQTLPQMTRSFHQEVTAERDQRLKEHQALLEMLAKLGEQQRKEHEGILDRIDFGFKELVNEITENRTALEKLQDPGRRPR